MTDQEWGVKPPGWHGQPPPDQQEHGAKSDHQLNDEALQRALEHGRAEDMQGSIPSGLQPALAGSPSTPDYAAALAGVREFMIDLNREDDMYGARDRWVAELDAALPVLAAAVEEVEHLRSLCEGVYYKMLVGGWWYANKYNGQRGKGEAMPTAKEWAAAVERLGDADLYIDTVYSDLKKQRDALREQLAAVEKERDDALMSKKGKDDG